MGKYFWCLPNSQALLLSHISRLVKFVHSMPQNNFVSERSASALQRIKKYLRSTMTQSRLNNVMVIQIHKDLTYSINHCKYLMSFHQQMKKKVPILDVFETNLAAIMLGWFCELLSFCAKYRLNEEVKGSKWFRVPIIRCYTVLESEARGCYSNGFEGL